MRCVEHDGSGALQRKYAYLSRFISCREGKRHRITSTSRGRDIAANEVAMVSSVVENLRELLADDPDLDSAALLGKLLELHPDLERSPQVVSSLTAVVETEVKIRGGQRDLAEARRQFGQSRRARKMLEATRRREQEAKQTAADAVEQGQQALSLIHI